MKTILACTDFSYAAQNACTYAAALGEAFRARLVLTGAYKREPVVMSETPVFIGPKDVKDVARSLLNDEAKRIRTAANVLVKFYLEEGRATNVILKAAREVHADLIVLGIKEHGKKLRQIFGSTVTGLARRTKIPLILVPENYTYEKPDTIVFAYESDTAPDSDPHLLNILRVIAERFHSKICLVHVSNNKYLEAFDVLNRPFRLQKMLRTLEPEFENLHGKDLAKVLGEFIKEFDANMIALLPHHHSLLERFFLKSATPELIFKTNIPVMILPDLRKNRE